MDDKKVIEERVRQVIIDILDVKEEQVRPQAHLLRDLNASSIDIVEISTALQNAFDIKVDDVEASRLGTVEDAVSFVQLALENKRSNEVPEGG